MSASRARHRCILTLWATALLSTLGAGAPRAQPIPGEYGDAPEGGLAYPGLGVLGGFPTCIDIGGYYVSHGPVQLAWFGVGVDFEPNGNGGPCSFPPYEIDECWGPTDLDAGLLGATPFTIDPSATQVLPCGVVPVNAIGNPCQIVSWGPAFDMVVNNVSGIDCAVNVLVDWNRDGRWAGQSTCPGGGVAEEHAVQNLPVPDGYAGTLAGLGAAALQLGPDPGYFWVRFTIASFSEAVPLGWTGAQQFDFGETEDYLLLVGQPAPAGELGDAPDEVLAYPDNGVQGHFPTCLSGPNGYALHTGNAGAWLGSAVDLEGDGNANLCSFAVYDNDECGAGGEGGLLLADPFTIDAGMNLVPCAAGEETPLGAPCAPLVWGVDIDLWIENGTADTRWLNALFDWDNNGRWGDWVTCTDGTTGNEHALQDFAIPGGYVGPLSALGPADFVILRGTGWVWSRFTLSDAPVAVAGWDGQGTFADGETEDYLFRVQGGTGAPPLEPALGRRLILEPAVPNPFNPSTQIAFTLREAGPVRVTIHDLAGRRLATLLERSLAAGRQTLEWRGRDDAGRALGSGVYFVRVVAGGEIAQGKLALVK